MTKTREPAAVRNYQKRLARVQSDADKLYHEVLPWAEKRAKYIVDPGAAESIAALGVACYNIGEAVKAALGINLAWVPPRRPPVRKYRGLRVGDVVVVAERWRDRTPAPIRTERLTVVEAEELILTVAQENGQRWGLERRCLVAAPKVTA